MSIDPSYGTRPLLIRNLQYSIFKQSRYPMQWLDQVKWDLSINGQDILPIRFGQVQLQLTTNLKESLQFGLDSYHSPINFIQLLIQVYSTYSEWLFLTFHLALIQFSINFAILLSEGFRSTPHLCSLKIFNDTSFLFYFSRVPQDCWCP